MLPFVLVSLLVFTVCIVITFRYKLLCRVYETLTSRILGINGEFESEETEPSESNHVEKLSETIVEPELGKTLMEEEPYAAAISTKFLPFTCSKCFDWTVPGENRITLHRCTGCKVMYYCSKKCKKEDWEDHKPECSYFRTIDVDSIPNHSIRVVARMLRKSKSYPEWKAFNGRTYESLLHHREYYALDKNFMYCVDPHFHQIRTFMGSDAPDFETFFIAKCKLAINSFGLGIYTPQQEYRGTGLYLGLSVHNHSCRPDAYFLNEGSKLLIRTTNMDCVYSDKVTISYYSLGYSDRRERRQRMYMNYFFVCKCVECEDVESDRKMYSGKSSCCIRGWFAVDDPRCRLCNKEVPLELRDKAKAANKSLKDALRNELYFDKSLNENSAEDLVSSMLSDFFVYQDILSAENVNLRLLAMKIRDYTTDFVIKIRFTQILYSILRNEPYTKDYASLLYEWYKTLEDAKTFHEAKLVLGETIEKVTVVFGKNHNYTKFLLAKKSEYDNMESADI